MSTGAGSDSLAISMALPALPPMPSPVRPQESDRYAVLARGEIVDEGEAGEADAEQRILRHLALQLDSRISPRQARRPPQPGTAFARMLEAAHAERLKERRA